jgi:hypothetical protein
MSRAIVSAQLSATIEPLIAKVDVGSSSGHGGFRPVRLRRERAWSWVSSGGLFFWFGLFEGDRVAEGLELAV